jgi:hypothetical protein
MCINAKSSLLSFGIMAGIALALFIRNEQYDKLLATLLITIAIIQLWEYFYHTGSIHSDTIGRGIFITLWLQVAVLAFALYWHFKTNLTTVWIGIYIPIFIFAFFYAMGTSFSVTKEAGHLVWTRGEHHGSILGSYSSWVYLIGLVAPILIILYYNNWQNTGMWIILLAIALSIGFVKWFYPSIVFPSMWCYSATFIAFTFWLISAFNKDKPVA